WRAQMTCLHRGLAALAKAFGLTVLAAAALLNSWLKAQEIPSITDKKALKPEIGAIASMKHDIQTFGKTNDGQEVKVHTLTNIKGLRVRLIDYGATLISVEAPDRNGKNAKITLGFPTLD